MRLTQALHFIYTKELPTIDERKFIYTHIDCNKIIELRRKCRIDKGTVIKPKI